MNFNSYQDENIFNEWISVRSRIGRSKRSPIDLGRSQAAKSAWKMNRPKMTNAIKRWHNSPSGKRFHRSLARFNQNKRGRVGERLDYELISPLFCLSISEYMSYVMYQSDFNLYEDVYNLQDLISLVINSPDVLEDILNQE